LIFPKVFKKSSEGYVTVVEPLGRGVRILHDSVLLFADLATVTAAYNNVHVEPRPVEWQLKKTWVISVILGGLLTAGTWIMRGTLFLSNGGVIQNFGSI
jgi:hypothetical protein